MSLMKRLLIIFVLTLIAVGDGFAQSFEEAMSLALGNNPQLLAATSEYKAIRQTQFVALSASLPQVEAYARSSTNDMKTNCLVDLNGICNGAAVDDDAVSLTSSSQAS